VIRVVPDLGIIKAHSIPVCNDRKNLPDVSVESTYVATSVRPEFSIRIRKILDFRATTSEHVQLEERMTSGDVRNRARTPGFSIRCIIVEEFQ